MTVFLARPPEGWQDTGGDREETEIGPSTDDAGGNETGADNETDDA
ncbi:hypothetical protein [Natrinema hispanicum]|uniref:Uncharacterized protein n=1 Tax=Natrinema hispanicum TaxID=392421 RepID=A0A1G6PXD0_9EURY|nr:hypothetical protein [Natrinema hispanicum]SDC84708.1 hypothetical protein SAMN05192552_100843 [Natrinema hispanicum]